jgi:hypothetical protein
MAGHDDSEGDTGGAAQRAQEIAAPGKIAGRRRQTQQRQPALQKKHV